MSVILQSSGGGQITLQEPTTASNFTQTLPASTGTIVTTGSPQSGSVIQVVNSIATSNQTSNATATYADTGLTATITPKFATSKILVICSQGMFKDTTSPGIFMQLLRGSTSLLVNGRLGITDVTAGCSFIWSCNYLDSPATTSATTYKTQFRNFNTTGVAYVNVDNSTAQITLLEIAA